MPKVKSAKSSRVHGEVQKQGIQFNKTFGQHILKNPLVVTSMIEKVSSVGCDLAILNALFSHLTGCPQAE